MSDETSEPAGGITIGSMTGGAVAQGDEATARDEGRRQTAAPAGEVPANVPAPAEGGIAIGVMQGGAVAQGKGARAVDASVTVSGPDAERLLAAVRQLRRELLDQPPSDEAEDLERDLVGVTDEVRRAGSADRSRLARLRERLEVSSMGAAIGASAVAVAQAITQLLG
ncbi:hypothetical protein SRB5_66140 [Streptomyces sp. RB5]|uniref:Uncharacterized protein n=1 Tax=Streptomyces smaragdinus TaxID=2585196 RepID=A0A7K0CSE5_9ACTN|nr:hypothetical protein [Streptomyces smaragdinus]MQY16415.1 hypothetical protein [Streptomyces smaragdinus]